MFKLAFEAGLGVFMANVVTFIAFVAIVGIIYVLIKIVKRLCKLLLWILRRISTRPFSISGDKE